MGITLRDTNIIWLLLLDRRFYLLRKRRTYHRLTRQTIKTLVLIIFISMTVKTLYVNLS